MSKKREKNKEPMDGVRREKEGKSMKFRILLAWRKGCKRKVNSLKNKNRVYILEFKNLIEEGAKRDACIKDQLLDLFSIGDRVYICKSCQSKVK